LAKLEKQHDDLSDWIGQTRNSINDLQEERDRHEI
jgi:hypothetical protein